MAFVRTKYGIEYDADDDSRGSSRGSAGWIVAALAAVAAVAAAYRAAPKLFMQNDLPAPAARPEAAPGQPPGRPAAQPPNRPTAQPPGHPAPAALTPMDMKRPKKVRNLLLRLKEAESKGDIEMQAMAIWQLQELPGDPAADLVASLAPRLGELNMIWLFGRKNPKWVSHVEVKSGDSPLRIAAMHGSTLASMARLNGWRGDPPQIRPGEMLYVMERPRFSIVAHRKTGEVDLFLGGRLFKRYTTKDGKVASSAKSGQYSTITSAGKDISSKGFPLSAKDAAELDMLVPRGAGVNID